MCFSLIEVADSSVLYDREEKRAAYARAGIAEYWLVNLPERLGGGLPGAVSGAGSYGWSARIRPGENVAPVAFPDAALAVGELFPTAEP